MKIYLASSWKMSDYAIRLAKMLRLEGHEVDCFADTSTGRYVFNYHELGDHSTLDGIEALRQPGVQCAFNEDKRWIDWAEAVVLLLPCGRSAHLEAGYAKGKGKHLFIIGTWPKGELDVMYGFADALCRCPTELAAVIRTVGARL